MRDILILTRWVIVMADQRGGSERKNYIIKTLLIAILLLLALLSTVFYVYAYPKSTITLYSICGNNQEKESSFQIKKYSTLDAPRAIEKRGYSFQYWAYDITGYDRFNGNKEVDVDYLDLFGIYEVKEFNVRLWIQQYDGDTKLDEPVLYKTYSNIKFNTRLTLWDGIDSSTGNLDSRLSARTGYDFVGWTTKVQEEDVMDDGDVVLAGASFLVLNDSDVDLYAYWEKREFDVITHTGNEYQMNGNTPARDNNGKFIIRNNSLLGSSPIKYLNTISSITTIVQPSLIEADGVVDDSGYNDNGEYEFKGWFLDSEYTIPATEDLTVRIIKENGEEVPYLISASIADPTASDGERAVYNTETGKYEFHLYSKWERKSYTLSFKKNLSGASGPSTQIASITVYKYDDHYGKYYQTKKASEFTRENADSEYYNSLDLSLESITTSAFKTAFSSYQFYGWSPDSKTSTTSVMYYGWTQTKDMKVNNYSRPTYENETYTHLVSEDVTLYAQWKTIRTVTFYQKSSASGSTGSFTIKGIEGEWIVLPGTSKIVDELGWTNKSYNFFAGWKQSSYADPIYEYSKGKDTNGDGKDDNDTSISLDQNNYKLDASGNKILNQDYIYVFGSKSVNFNYYAYWENKIYTVEFYYNDGTDYKEVKSVKGGNNITFPSSPTRENYIFDGWSATQYEDNVLGKTLISGVATAVGESQVIKYYASWTMNFTVSYDANGGATLRNLPTVQYASKGKNLTMEVQALNASSYISKEGNTFDGWMLRNADGTFDEEFTIGQRETYVFSFASDPYMCYKKQQTNRTHEVLLGTGKDGEKLNEVILYAKWKPNEYRITIVDGITSAKTTLTAKYASEGSLDLQEYITEHIGYKFTHLSTTRNGSDRAIEPEENGAVLLPNNSILSNLTFYANYELRNIFLSYKILDKTNTVRDYTNFSSSFSSGNIRYGDIVILPTPNGVKDYGDSNFLFKYWYYLEGEGDDQTEVIVENNTRLKYDGAELVLWAKFEEQKITISFKFENPLDPTDVINITTIGSGEDEQEIIVQKGDTVSQELYDEIMEKINSYIEERDGIKEYTLDGIYYYYFGQRYIFAPKNDIPSQDSTGKITYTTSFSANSVTFVYEFTNDKNETQRKTAHEGNNYDSKSDIILESVSRLGFTMGEGESINAWYLLEHNDPDGSRYSLQLGDYLIKALGGGDYFKSVADMSDYIVWEVKDGKYEGTITIHAETEKTITVNYFAISQDGELKKIQTTGIKHNSLGNSITLLSEKEALQGFENTNGLIFNGWRVYKSDAKGTPIELVTSLGDDGLVDNVLNIDVDNIFTSYAVNLYADISYVVEFNKVVKNDDAFVIEKMDETSYPLATQDYHKQNSYKMYHTINTVKDMGETPNGYEYYGYKIGNNIYTKSQIEQGFNLDITGEKIQVLCYIARVVKLTYTVNSDLGETFGDDTTDDKVIKYMVDYEDYVMAIRGEDGVDVATTVMTIANLEGQKFAHYFAGWSMKIGGSISSQVLEAGTVVYIYEDTTFVAVFKEPETGSLKAKFVYKYVVNENADTDEEKYKILKTVEVANINGKEYTLLTGQDVGYSFIDSGIVGWTYNGQTLDKTFSVPLLINNGQTFEFVAIIKEKYTLKFETYSKDTVADMTLYENTEYRLSEVPTLDNGKTFIAWGYTLSNGKKVEIKATDAIIFRASTDGNQVIYSCNPELEYDLHIIPAEENVHIYTFYAIGEDIKLTLYANDENSFVLENVPFGQTYTVRELVTKAGFEKYETDGKGIVAWTTDPNKTDYASYSEDEKKALINNITGIGSDKTLYAVWQNKRAVNYASESDTFAYQSAPGTEYYFAGDSVYFNANVLKSVYFKGYNTVYFDNGTYIVYPSTPSGNDYYMVTSYNVKYADGTNYLSSVDINEAFEMPDKEEGVIITPIFSQVHRALFYDNTGTGEIVSTDALLYTAYAVDLKDIVLDSFVASRTNFTFKGWSLSREGEIIHSLPAGTKEDTILYAVWESDISIAFTINGENNVFKVPLTRESKINSTILTSYLTSPTGTKDNGYFAQIKLSNNERTYSFNNVNYYLDYFVCSLNRYYTISELCEVEFTRATSVNMILDKVYTIKYIEVDEYDHETARGEDYFVKTSVGGYSSLAVDGDTLKPLKFLAYEYTNEYYTASGWVDDSNKLYSFEATASDMDYSTLVSHAENMVVTLTLNRVAKAVEIVLYDVENPYSLYSSVSNAEEAKASSMWQNVASTYARDYSGNIIAGSEVEGKTQTSLAYGSSLTLTYPSTPTNNYQIIGWSREVYALGNTGTGNSSSNIYYSYNYLRGNGMYAYEDTIYLDKSILTGGKLVLYPVYQLVTMHEVSIFATDGEVSYTIANNDEVLKGYIHNPLTNTGNGTGEALDLQFSYFQNITIKADQPKKNYTLSSFTYNGENVEGDLEIVGFTATTYKHRVVVEYAPKTISVSLSLQYSKNLISGTDTSTISINDITLSATNTTGTLEVPVSEQLRVVDNSSTYYVLESIKAGESTITLIDSAFSLSNLTITDDKVNIVFTLAPKTYNATLNLQGGALSTFTYNSSAFGTGDVEKVDGKYKIIADATITLGTPTKDKCEFVYFTINGTRYDSITNYTVSSDIAIIAFFMQNRYNITYIFSDGALQRVEFVGGSTISIGDGLATHEIAGIQHLGWKLSGDNSAYTDGDSFATTKKDYTFNEVVKGKDVVITFKTTDGTTLTPTMTVEYGKEFKLPDEDFFTSTDIAGKALYGFADTADVVEGTTYIIKRGTTITLSTASTSSTNIQYIYTDDGAVIYAVFFAKYTYTFEYVTSTESVASDTIIANESTTVTAISSAGGVDVKDLIYTINSITPQPKDSNYVFAGYKYTINGVQQTITLDGAGAQDIIISAGEKITLVNPDKWGYVGEYKYVLTAIYKSTSDLKELEIVITNPVSGSGNLTLTIEGKEESSYVKSVPDSTKLYASNLPLPDYTGDLDIISWKIGDDVVFTTSESGIIAHKVIGYRCEFYDSDNKLMSNLTKDITLDGNGISIVDGFRCVLTTLWEDRYLVVYYDTEGNTKTSQYYDRGTLLKVTNEYEYSSTGYMFVGYAESQDAVISSVNDFMAFDAEFEVTRDYHLYPAFSKLYTAKFHDNLDLLAENGGDRSSAEKLTDKSLVAYIGMPSISLSAYYSWVYAGVGYSFDGLTIVAGTLSNDLEEGAILEDQYQLDIAHIINDELNIYVAWGVEEKEVTFEISAISNDAGLSYYQTTPITLTYRYNQSIDLDYDKILEVFEERTLNANTKYIIENFQFNRFATSRSGGAIDTYVVQSDATIYLVFDYKYTIVYNIGNAQYVDGAPEVEDVSALHGTTISGYDANTYLILEGRGGLYWTPTKGSDIHFFDGENKHTFTDSDRNYASTNYVINLYLGSDVAQYTVYLNFYYNEKDFNDNVFTKVSLTLPYGSSIMEVTEDEFGEVASAESPFDSQIASATNGARTSLYSLFDMFVGIGYEFNGRIMVNDEFTYISSYYDSSYYYTVQTYSSETLNAYTNDIYLYYSLISYDIKLNAIAFENESDISTPSSGYLTDKITTVLQISRDGEEDFMDYNVSNVFPYITDTVTRKSDINLIYVQDVAEDINYNNKSYTFYGYRAAVKDSDGNIISFIDIINGENWSPTHTDVPRSDNKYGGVDHIYHVIGDVEIYAIYIERQVKVSLVYEAEDGTPEDHLYSLSTKITLNGEEVEDSSISKEKLSSSQIKISFKALYGQTLYICDTDTEGNYYVINNIYMNSVGINNNKINTQLISESGDLKSFELLIKFETLKVNVYAYTTLDLDIFATEMYAKINSVEVYSNFWKRNITISKGEDIYEEINIGSSDGVNYNYVIRIPYGCTIKSINAELNNYSIPSWSVRDGASIKILEDLVVDGEKYILANLVPDTISVVFCASDGTQLQVDSYTVTYGDMIDLPYIVIDEDTAVSTGWSIGIYNYSWGESINAISPINEEVNGTLKILASVTNKYYLVFKNGDGCSFDIPDMYTTPSNAAAITEMNVGMGAGSYTYYILSTHSKESKVVDTYTTIFPSRFVIPEELQFTDKFGGWLVSSGDIIADYYELDKNDITADTNEIILTTTLNGIVSVKFYITNPENSGETLKLSTSNSGPYDIDYMTLYFDVEKGTFFSYVNITNSGSNKVQWSAGYFAETTATNILDDYEFYGWAQSKVDVLDHPSLSNISGSVLRYTWGIDGQGRNIRTTLDRETLNSNILSLLKQEGCSYTFYSVWEEKKTVVFDGSDFGGDKISNKYAEGETIELPNSQTMTLTNGHKKWVGWQGDNGVEYLFGQYTYIYAPSSSVTFSPMWADGTSVLFDINFDEARNYYADVISSTMSGSTIKDDIHSRTGYPYLKDGLKYTSYTEKQNTLYIDGQYITNTKVATTYQEGDFFSAGDTVAVYKYIGVFNQTGIYTQYGKLDEYFVLVGWMYNGELITTTDEKNQTIFNITEDIINSSDKGVITLKACWRPVDLNITFYYSEDDAKEENAQKYTTITVPFGYKLTSVQDNAKPVDKYLSEEAILYMYDSETGAPSMSNPTYMIDYSKKDLYRLDYWKYWNDVEGKEFFNNKGVASYEENTVSDRVLNHMKLYPEFSKLYMVEYLTLTGDSLGLDLVSVGDGDTIPVTQSLSGLSGIIRNVYYVSKSGTQTSLLNNGKLKDVVFNEEDFQVYDEFYIYIYVEINIVLNAYTPTYSGNSVTTYEYGRVNIYQGFTYTLRELFSLTDEYIRNNYGSADAYPSFGGWFLGETNDYYNSPASRRVSDDRINTILISIEGTGNNIRYYLIINNDVQNRKSITPSDGGLTISLFAKFYTQTTISLGEQNDQNIAKYAELTYDETDSNIGEFYTITSTTIGNDIKTISYVTTYNSEYAPNIIITPKFGYKISSISGIDGATYSELDSKTTVSNLIYSPENNEFKSVFSKTTTTESSNMKIVYTLNISNIQKTNNLVFNIALDTIKYTVVYTYNNKDVVLQYKSASGVQNSTSFNEVGGEITFYVDTTTYGHVYYNANVVDRFKVSYVSTTSGDNTTVTISDVPYGYQMFISASSIQLLRHHFEYWNVEADGAERINETIGEIKDTYQIFAPQGLFDNKKYITTINISPVVALNELKEIVYKFKFSNITDATWTDILENAFNTAGSGLSKEGDIYTYTWSPANTIDGKGIPTGMTLKATDSLDALFSKVQELYNDQFNKSYATITGSWNINAVLNYFWFTNVWKVPNDIDNKDCAIYEGNTLGVTTAGVLTIYSEMDSAVIVNANHQVIDYLDNNNAIIDGKGNRVDRADISFERVINEKGVEVERGKDFFILKEDANNIIVKVPYGYTAEFSVKGNDATDKHVAYKESNWVTIGKETNVAQRNGIIDTDTTKNYASYNGETLPELQFYANVVAETYAVQFKNNDGAVIKTINIAYDEVIASYGYSQYKYTLDILREANKLPLFDLDPKHYEQNGLTKFNHSDDEYSVYYGEYQYLFNTWQTNSGKSVTKSDSSGLISYSNSQYNTIYLNANYKKTEEITFTIISESGNNSVNTSFVSYYLPNATHTDEFGTEYYDYLLWDFVITSLNGLNSDYEIEDYQSDTVIYGTKEYAYYTFDASSQNHLGALYIAKESIEGNIGRDTDNFTLVNSVSETKGKYTVYPSIDVATQIDGKEYIIRTVGGRYLINMTTDDNNSYEAYLNYYNVLGVYNKLIERWVSGNKITQGINNKKQFAFWEVCDSYGNLLHRLASNTYGISSYRIITTHYNVMFDVNLSDDSFKGEVKNGDIVKNINYSGELVDLDGKTKLSNQNLTSGAMASKVYIDSLSDGKGDSEIEYRHIVVVNMGSGKLEIVDRTNIDKVKTLYSIQYTYYPEKNNNIPKEDIVFAWQITPSGNNKQVYTLESGNDVTILDEWGSFTITPIIYPPEVEITIENQLYIYNVNYADYQSKMGALIKTSAKDNTNALTIAGGSLLITDNELPFDNTSEWSSRLYFRPVNNNDNLSTLPYIKATRGSASDDFARLAMYTQNWRWQYYFGGSWIDVESDSTRINGDYRDGKFYTQIRLACEWLVVTVDLYSLNDNGLNINNSYNGKTFTGATDGSLVVYKDLSDPDKSTHQTITMLAGDTIEYDFASECITLNSAGAWYTVTSSPYYGYCAGSDYNQGWFRINGSSLVAMLENSTIKVVGGGTYSFVVWIEKQYEVSAVVDMGKYYIGNNNIVGAGETPENGTQIVNGYGNVTISSVDIKGRDIITHEASATEGKSGTYLSTTLIGASNDLRFAFADNSMYKHKFVQMKAGNDTYTADTLFSSRTGNISYSILYDASSTATEYIVADTSGESRYTATIYGGYTIEYEDHTNATRESYYTIYIKDMFGVLASSVNKDVEYDRLWLYNNVDTGDADSRWSQTGIPYVGYTIYPRYNYRYTNLLTYNNDSKDTATGGWWNIGGSEASAQTFTYTANAKSVVVFMNEYQYAVTLNLKTVLETENGYSTTTSGLDSNIINYFKESSSNYYEETYSEDGRLSTLRIVGFGTNENKKLSMYYDISPNRNAMVLGCRSIEEYLFALHSQTTYILKGLKLSGGSTNVTSDFWTTVGSSNTDTQGNKKDVDVSFPSYDLLVRVSESEKTTVAFKITLPYRSDLRALDIQSNLYGEGATYSGAYSVAETIDNTGNKVSFNQVYGYSSMEGLVNDNWRTWANAGKTYAINFNFTLPYKNVQVYATSSSNAYTLYFCDGTNTQIGYITFTLPTVYSVDGTYGWYVDNVNKFMTPTQSPYNAWSVDKSSLITVGNSGNKTRLNPVSTLVLSVQRKEVTIYLDTAGRWWNNLTKSTDYEDANIDINTYLKYGYMSSTGFARYATKITTYGGLVSAYPNNPTTDSFYSLAVKDEGTSNAIASSKPKAIDNHILSRIYIQTQDYALDDIRLDTGNIFRYGYDTTYGTCYTYTGSVYSYPTLFIAGAGDSTYNVELNTATIWYIAGIPSGDSGVNGNNYHRITFQQETGTDIGTYSFYNGTITLLQSITAWSDDDMISARPEQKTFSVWIGKDTKTRLFNGMYSLATTSGWPSNYYASQKLTFNTTKNPSNGKRRVLVGYEIYNTSGYKLKTIGYNDFDYSGTYSLNLTTYTQNLIIRAIWADKGVYTVNINSSMSPITSTSTRLLEGRSYTFSVNFNASKSLVTNVTSGSTTSTTKKVLMSDRYMFMGFRNVPGTDASMYEVSPSGTKDDNFDSFGAYRITYTNGGTSYSLQTHSSNVKSSKYSFTIQGINQDYNLNAIWHQLGYEVKYTFRGYTSSSTSNTLRSKYANSEDTDCYATVSYNNYLLWMPYRVAIDYNSNNFKNTIYNPSYWDISQLYYWDGSSYQGIGSGGLKYFDHASTIYFDLKHDNCCTTTNYPSEHLCETTSGSSHGYKNYSDTTCEYCAYRNKYETGTSECPTTTKLDKGNANQHVTYTYCNCSVCANKNRVINAKWENHNQNGTWTITYPTCTSNGKYQHYCTVCQRGEDNYFYGSKAAHTYGDWLKTSVTGTYKESYDCVDGPNGWYHKCSVCGDTEYTTGSSIGKSHNYSKSNGTTCYYSYDYCLQCHFKYYHYWCSYSYTNYALRATDVIYQPDAWHCQTNYVYIVFPCVNCGNTNKKINYSNKELRIMLRFMSIDDDQAAYSVTYNATSLINAAIRHSCTSKKSGNCSNPNCKVSVTKVDGQWKNTSSVSINLSDYAFILQYRPIIIADGSDSEYTTYQYNLFTENRWETYYSSSYKKWWTTYTSYGEKGWWQVVYIKDGSWTLDKTRLAYMSKVVANSVAMSQVTRMKCNGSYYETIGTNNPCTSIFGSEYDYRSFLALLNTSLRNGIKVPYASKTGNFWSKLKIKESTIVKVTYI